MESFSTSCVVLVQSTERYGCAQNETRLVRTKNECVLQYDDSI